MIRTNLSTRPFYNERAVRLWLGVLAALAVGATLFNVARVLQYSRSDTRLASQASRDEAHAADLRANAARLRASVDPKQLDAASADARQANQLIDRRTFSWTELLNRFETTLPDDVRIVAVRPKVDKNAGTLLTIVVVARGTDDVSQFMDKLEATGAFKELRGTSEERYNEQGLLEGTIETRYLPPADATEGAKPR
jgi:type IV pilus assembly protein PilN